MLKLVRRWWKYLTAKLTGSFNERADPKIQLEQAILEAQEQHARLKEQAANVIAIQKQTELQLNRKLDELDKLNAQTRQAVIMADDATRKGDTAKAGEYTRAAESIATRLIALEAEVEDLKARSLQAAQASDQAKAAVAQNSSVLQKKLAEKNQLMGQLEQAKMQEQMNKAMASLNETVGADVPTFNEVRDKIEARYAKASGAAELQGESVEARMLEVEQAAQNTEASARLAEIRAQLGLQPGTGTTDAIAPPQAQPQAEPGTAGA
jgi:phage shock protein A